MAEFEVLKKEIQDLRNMLKIERRDFDKLFHNYHKVFNDYWHTIVRIATMLDLDCVKEMKIRQCCVDNENNPIYKKLDELLKKVGEQ